MGDVLQRHLGGVADLDPGQYTTAGCKEIVDAQVLVRCSSCGGFDWLDGDYEIQIDGRVVPAWTCPTATCSRRLWLVLEAWK